jgi:hypothetical protein
MQITYAIRLLLRTMARSMLLDLRNNYETYMHAPLLAEAQSCKRGRFANCCMLDMIVELIARLQSAVKPMMQYRPKVLRRGGAVS